jgi:CRP-like cAMP-binding protein
MPSHNRLLAALSEADRQAFQPLLEPVELSLRQVLHEVGEPITHVVFVRHGVVSLVNEPNRGEIVEVATIGPEGMVGLAVALGVPAIPTRAFVQVPGDGFRVEAAAFTAFVESRPGFRILLMRYTMALLNQIAQNASCNRLHEVQERCARWLLQTHDRVDGDTFPLTQEFLAQMLGVHRPTVSIAAGMLQRAGLISYSRGIITILDRAGLRDASCSCYGFVSQEYERLLAPERP